MGARRAPCVDDSDFSFRSRRAEDCAPYLFCDWRFKSVPLRSSHGFADETYVGGKVRSVGRGYKGNKAIAAYCRRPQCPNKRTFHQCKSLSGYSHKIGQCGETSIFGVGEGRVASSGTPIKNSTVSSVMDSTSSTITGIPANIIALDNLYACCGGCFPS